MEEKTRRCPFCDEEIRVNAIKCRHCGSIVSSDTYPTGVTNNPDTLLKQIIGEKYEVSEVVGKGGMAMVYRAKHKSLQREVALKVVHQNLVHDSEFINRFLREARVGASLSHPNIVTIYDVGTIGPINYMAMEFLTGKTLRQVIHENGRLSVEDTIHYLTPIARALAYIHDRNLVHRDIKSSNVIIAGRRAVLTDFGIVFVRGEERLSTMGSVVGTPEYMSPEQAEGKEEVDHRADIYSLGVMFYEALTGSVPFHHDNPLATVHSLLNDIPPEPKELNPDIPDWLNSLVLACMVKSKHDRLQDCNELVEGLVSKKYISPDSTVRFNASDVTGKIVTKKVEKIQQGQAAKKISEQKKEEPVKKKKGNGLKIIGLIILLLIVAGAVGLYFNRDVIESVQVSSLIEKGESLESAKEYEAALLHYITALEEFPGNDDLENKVTHLRQMLIEQEKLAEAKLKKDSSPKPSADAELENADLQNQNTENRDVSQALTEAGNEEKPSSNNTEASDQASQAANNNATVAQKTNDAKANAAPVIEKTVVKNEETIKPKVEEVKKTPPPPVKTEEKKVEAPKQEINYAQIPGDFMSVLKQFGIELVYVPLVNKGFYIGKYEVTQKTWQQIMGKNPSALPGDNHPVEMINQADINEFLAELKKMTKLPFRLPTEKEWETVAKAGKNTKYSGGDRIEAVAWYEGNTSGSHTTVGKLAPNALGIYDMSGNVSELCEGFIRKGGSYNSTSNNCEISASKQMSPDTRDWTMGIRLCLTYTE